MEMILSASFENLKRYWRRREYQKVESPTASSKKKLKIVRFGGTKQRVWKLRTTRKLRCRIVPPTRVLARFHETYTSMMTILAAKMGTWNNKGLLQGKKIARDGQIIKVSSGEEVDCKLVLEVYKQLVASTESREL